MLVRLCTYLACVLGCCSSIALFVTLASAQTAAADKAMAETLFDRGLQLMRTGQFAEACSQLEQSQAIERGIGTLLYLAECYEKLGRSASAWAMFREAASAARAEGQPDRAKVGNTRADKLEPSLSKLSIGVAGVSTTQGLLVLRNGQPVPPGVWGLSVPVDPGDQRIEARAPGRVTWSTTVQLPGNAASVHVDVPELAVDSSSASPPLPAAEPSAPAPLAPAAPPGSLGGPEKTESGNSWQEPTGLVVGGVGVVGVLVGGYFGLRAIGKNNDADKACPNERCPSGAPSKLDEQAHTAAGLSTGFVIGGAALLVAGAVLFFTAPTSSETLHVGIGSTGSGAALQIGGRL